MDSSSSWWANGRHSYDAMRVPSAPGGVRPQSSPRNVRHEVPSFTVLSLPSVVLSPPFTAALLQAREQMERSQDRLRASRTMYHTAFH